MQTNDMEITGKTLLNSAEKILSGHREKTKTPESESASVKSDEVRSTAQMRLAGMQAGLNDMQRVYSREQARLNLLKDSGDGLNEQTSAEMTFEGEPLFPEMKGQWNRDELIRTVEQSLNEARARLKSMQVEMENHLAVEFSAAPDARLSGDLAAGIAGSRLDPERVARLTRLQG
ncbi:LIC10415 family protein [Leptonema illini]|nr:hypothetical protein [Leptonema illini]